MEQICVPDILWWRVRTIEYKFEAEENMFCSAAHKGFVHISILECIVRRVEATPDIADGSLATVACNNIRICIRWAQHINGRGQPSGRGSVAFRAGGSTIRALASPPFFGLISRVLRSTWKPKTEDI